MNASNDTSIKEREVNRECMQRMGEKAFKRMKLKRSQFIRYSYQIWRCPRNIGIINLQAYSTRFGGGTKYQVGGHHLSTYLKKKGKA